MPRRKPSIAVSEARGLRTLHVGGEAIQSSMRLEDPYALALDYTRCMMAFLLFHPEPREALMIGLGGGSLAKFFFRKFKQTSIRVVELDPRVVAALALAYIACGRLDAYIEEQISEWDIAAGKLLLEAAGGDFIEQPSTVKEGKLFICATNGKIDLDGYL